jgi:hypothetical protein
MTDEAAAAAMTRARQADQRLWSSVATVGSRDLVERDRAVREAVAVGASVERLAVELGVGPADVERMLTLPAQ